MAKKEIPKVDTEILNAAAAIERLVEPFKKATEILTTVNKLAADIPLWQDWRDQLEAEVETFKAQKEIAAEDLKQFLVQVAADKDQAKAEAKASVSAILVSKNDEIATLQARIHDLKQSIEGLEANFKADMQAQADKMALAKEKTARAEKEYQEFIAGLTQKAV